MTARYYGIDKGAQYTTVTNGTSTTSKAVEVVVADQATMTRQQVVLAVEQILQGILNDRATPYAQ